MIEQISELIIFFESQKDKDEEHSISNAYLRGLTFLKRRLVEDSLDYDTAESLVYGMLRIMRSTEESEIWNSEIRNKIISLTNQLIVTYKE